MDRAAALLAQVRTWCAQHPVTPAGAVQDRMRPKPDCPVRPAFLLRALDGTSWFVRWPNGQARWESTAALTRRGIPLPAQPVIGELEP